MFVLERITTQERFEEMFTFKFVPQTFICLLVIFLILIFALVIAGQIKRMKRILSDAIFYNKENVDNNYKTEFIKSYPEAKKKLYILVTSNMGLCGGYNNNIIRLLKNIYVAGDEIMVIGEKGYLALTKEEDIKLDTSFLHILSGYSLTKVSGLTNHVMKRYLTKEYKEIDLVYTRYKNSIAFIPEVKKILPIEVHDKIWKS